jgi:hypothetical protein
MTETVSEMQVNCATCDAPVDVEGPVLVRQREGGQRVWVAVHDCGTGLPLTVPLGICPRPVTRLQAFRHHLHHGLLMRYRLWSVIRFAWKQRTSFEMTPFD